MSVFLLQGLERVLSSQSCLFVTLWTVVHQIPLSMVFPSLEYWSGLPFTPPGDLSDSGIEPASPTYLGSLVYSLLHYYKTSFIFVPVCFLSVLVI